MWSDCHHRKRPILQFMFFSALEQRNYSDQEWIQSVALGIRKPLLGFLQGKDDNMCPAVRHSCWPLKWYPGWVQTAVGGCNTSPKVAPSIGLWQYCNPVKYQCVLGFVLLCYNYWSYIIETLWLQYFPFLKESMSFAGTSHAAPAKLNEYIWSRQSCLFLDKYKGSQSSNYCIVCGLFFTQGEIGQCFHWWPSGICFFFVCRDTIFLLSWHRHRHCLQLSETKLRELDWYSCLCETLHTPSTMAVTYSLVYACFIICDLEWSHRWSEWCFSH